MKGDEPVPPAKWVPKVGERAAFITPPLVHVEGYETPQIPVDWEVLKAALNNPRPDPVPLLREAIALDYDDFPAKFDAFRAKVRAQWPEAFKEEKG